MIYLLTRADKILIILLTILSLSGIIYSITIPKSNNSLVIITVNGKIVNSVPLGDAHQLINVPVDNGLEIVEIHNRRVRIVEADCPDKLCVKMNWISRAPQQIVCLPNRVVVKVVDSYNTDIDAVIR